MKFGTRLLKASYNESFLVFNGLILASGSSVDDEYRGKVVSIIGEDSLRCRLPYFAAYLGLVTFSSPVRTLGLFRTFGPLGPSGLLFDCRGVCTGLYLACP